MRAPLNSEQAFEMGREDAALAMRILCDLIVDGYVREDLAERARARVVRTLFEIRLENR